jgi:hypothetical protein
MRMKREIIMNIISNDLEGEGHDLFIIWAFA